VRVRVCVSVRERERVILVHEVIDAGDSTDNDWSKNEILELANSKH